MSCGTRLIFCTLLCCYGVNCELFLNNGLVSTLSAIQNVLKYWGAHLQEVNLDVVFGLRVIEGQCKLLSESHEKGEMEFSSADLIRQIVVLGTEAGRLANVAIPHVHEQDRQYFKRMNQLTVGPWKVFHPHRVVNPSLRWQTLPNAIGFTVEFSDRCLSDLMVGTAKNPKPCQVTENCLTTMLTPGQAGFYLQRQIFYTILAQKMGCETVVNEFLVARTRFKSLEQVQHEFCTNAYYEIDDVVALYSANKEFRNLFLEMEFLCPSIGYFQFVKGTWLEDIVSWQSPAGCFPATLDTVPATVLNRSDAAGLAAAAAATSHPAAASPAKIFRPTSTNSASVQPDLPNIPPPPGFQHRRQPETAAGNEEANGERNDTGVAFSSDDQRGPLPSALGLDSPMRDDTPLADGVFVGAPGYNSYVGGSPRLNHGPADGVVHSVVDPSHVGKQIRGYLDNDLSNNNNNNNGGGDSYSNDVSGRLWPSLYDAGWEQRQSNAFGQRVPVAGAQQYVQPAAPARNYAFSNDVAYHGEPRDTFLRGGAPQVVPYHHDGSNGVGAGVDYGMPGRRVAADSVTDGAAVPGANEYRRGRGLKAVVIADGSVVSGSSANHVALFKDKNLTGGCLAHFTSFASAALAMYLRYLVDPGPPEFTHLRLENFRRSKNVDKSGVYSVLSNDTKYLRVDGVDSHRAATNSSSEPRPDLQDMVSRANVFMGTYRRQWDTKFRPVYVGPMARMDLSRNGLQADYVHQAEIRKELPDWTVSYPVAPPSSDNVTLAVGPTSTAAASPPRAGATWWQYKDTGRSSGESTELSGDGDPRFRLVNFRSPLQRDLDHYLVAVAVVSVVFLVVIFRYFRRRRSRLLRLKARHL